MFRIIESIACSIAIYILQFAIKKTTFWYRAKKLKNRTGIKK